MECQAVRECKAIASPWFTGKECLLSQDIARRWLLAIPALLGVDVSAGPLRKSRSSISLNW